MRRLPEVREVTIKLEDHYTGDEINAALGRGDGFAGAFPGETVDDDLAALARAVPAQGAGRARVSAVREAAERTGPPPRRWRRRRLEDLPDDVPDARRCVELRRRLGLAHDPGEPAFVLPNGEPVAAAELKRWLRTARLVRMSLEVNGGMCRSLMQIRHGVAIDDPEEVLR